MIRGLLLTLALALPFASANAASSCESAFQPASKLAVDQTFDPSSFESQWLTMQSRFEGRTDISVTKWVDQTARDAKLMKVVIKSKGPTPLKILITGGVHGNEPLGTMTALDLIEVFAKDPSFANRAIELTVIPAINYEGLTSNVRRSRAIDLNRSFEDETLNNAKIKSVKEAIGSSPYDLALDLHGSKSRAEFFVIKQSNDNGVAARALKAIPGNLRLKSDAGTETGPLGVPTRNGYDSKRYTLEAAGLSTSTNQGTLKSYVQSLGTTNAYTLEYPGQLEFKKTRETFLNLALSFIREAAAAQTKISTDTHSTQTKRLVGTL